MGKQWPILIDRLYLTSLESHLMTHHYNTFRDQLAIAHLALGYALWEPDPSCCSW